MAAINHTDRAHALLSASAAKRWLACPPSARIGDKHEKGGPPSVYALEGTFAHELSELHFAHMYEGMTKRTFNSRLKKMKESEFYDEELHDYVMEYVGMVEERINAAKARSDMQPVLMFEERLDYSSYAPEGFGTGDVIVYSGGHLEIIDLKFGKGVEVSADNNPQLKLYALGAVDLLDMIHDIDTVSMTIFQPRLNNFSTFEMDHGELVEWGQAIRPTAQLAYEGKGEFNPGEHCQFCPIKATCKARAEKVTGYVKDMKEPYLLDKEEMADLLYEVDEIAKWAKDVKAFAQEQALDGVEYEGWKLVEGRSLRKYTDEDEVAHTLHENGYKDKDFFDKPKLLSISKLEKAIGKKVVSELLSDYITKPPGKPALVPESDKRPAMNSADQDFDEIKEG